jgi:hypothetical protein
MVFYIFGRGDRTAASILTNMSSWRQKFNPGYIVQHPMCNSIGLNFLRSENVDWEPGTNVLEAE